MGSPASGERFPMTGCTHAATLYGWFYMHSTPRMVVDDGWKRLDVSRATWPCNIRLHKSH